MMIFITIYLIIAVVLFFLLEPMISGGNISTEFWLKNKFDENEIKVVSSLLWLPIFIYVFLEYATKHKE